MPHTYADAQRLVDEWVQSASLRKHCLAVSSAMRHFAKKSGADEELWATVGLFHDLDYERFPNAAHSPDAEHPSEAAKLLRSQGWSEEIARAILSHADYCNVPRNSALEKTLYAVDELSGFIVAVTMVRPDKNIAGLEVSSVKKKLKDKAFAKAVNRDDIVRGAAELGIPLDELIQEVINGLRTNAAALGLAGAT
jgi:putative nucleotidyltransferase with HDIG domain